MKKAFLGAILAVTSLCYPLDSRGNGKMPQQDTDNPPAIIEGVTNIIPDSTVITLFRFYGNAGMSVAKDTVINGKFRLEYTFEDDDVQKMSIACFVPEIAGSGRTVFLSPGANIKVDASTIDSQLWEVTSDLDEQKEYDRLLFSGADIYREINRLNSEMDKLLSNPELSREQRIQIIAETREALSALHDSIDNRKYLTMLQMKHTPVWFDEFISLSDTGSSGDSPLTAKLKTLYESLGQSEKESPEGERIYAYLYPESKINIGDQVPDMEFIDINGNTRTLGEFAGKWILLDIWSGGCGPCHMAVPELKAFAEKHKDNVAVVSISIDDDKFWKISTENLKLEGNNWRDSKGQAGIYSRFNAQGLPTFIVINPEGVYTKTQFGYGKGMFERVFRPLLNPKPAMSLEKTATGTKVNYPDCSENNTDDILEIDSIELGDDRTVIHFHMYYIPNWWIKIAPESYLELPDGSKLNIIEAQGITLGEELRANADGENKFTLVFPAISKDAQSVSFIESANWNLKNIKLVP
ncbi:MAG: TlpA family protein disulfide reductase [Paramuribaculum sp.]|nr:TlpA family protein disulfide reductase [Paramuribaculum sp.]